MKSFGMGFPESLAKYKLYRHGGKCCEAGGNTAREGTITAELNGSQTQKHEELYFIPISQSEEISLNA